jgi:hypothetical protein
VALGTDPGRLLGIAPPERDTARAEQLRRAAHALDLPDFSEPVDVLALPELHDAASGACSDYLAGRHTELLAGLPALMVDTRRAAHVLAGDHAAEAAGLLATSYRLAAGLSGRLGLVDRAAHAAHRALDTTRFTTRPELDEAAALRYLAWVCWSARVTWLRPCAPLSASTGGCWPGPEVDPHRGVRVAAVQRRQRRRPARLARSRGRPAPGCVGGCRPLRRRPG